MRLWLIGYIALLLALLSTSATLFYLSQIEGVTYQLKQATQATVLNQINGKVSFSEDQNNRLTAKIKEIDGAVTTKGAELKSKEDELAKLNLNLKASDRELTAASQKVKAQQDQLATESAELTRLRQRPADRPPLFSFGVPPTSGRPH